MEIRHVFSIKGLLGNSDESRHMFNLIKLTRVRSPHLHHDKRTYPCDGEYGKEYQSCGTPGARITSPFDLIRKGTPVPSPYSLDDPCCLMDLKRHGYMITENLLLAVIQKQ